MKILLATHNLHKLREFKAMLQPLSLFDDIVSFRDIGDYTAPEETGKTYEDNALLKARDAASQTGLLSIADDSGLTVPALNGSPGVYSARYAGKDASDKDNRALLLQEMKGLSGFKRAAMFECYIAMHDPSTGYEKVFKGVCEGLILEEERGSQGFGYDSLFIKHDYDKSFAELTESVKNHISHRRKALDKLLMTLESYP